MKTLIAIMFVSSAAFAGTTYQLDCRKKCDPKKHECDIDGCRVLSKVVQKPSPTPTAKPK